MKKRLLILLALAVCIVLAVFAMNWFGSPERIEAKAKALLAESPDITDEQILSGELPVNGQKALELAIESAKDKLEKELSDDERYQLEVFGMQLVVPAYAMRAEEMKGKAFWAVLLNVLREDSGGKLGVVLVNVFMSEELLTFYTNSEELEQMMEGETMDPLPFVAGRYESGWPSGSRERFPKVSEVNGKYDGHALALGKLPMSFETAASRAKAHCKAAVDRYVEVYGGNKDGYTVKDVATVGYIPSKELWLVEFYYETAEETDFIAGFDFFLPIEILPNGECFPFLEDFVKYTGDPNEPRPEVEDLDDAEEVE